jgi:hydroxyacylglutathione hydrolase
MILRQIQVGNMAVFAYIVGDSESGEGLVIDPAANTSAILEQAAEDNLTIKYIVNTHGHVDHIGGNADMKQKTGAAIVVHNDDADMLISTPEMMLRMFQAKASPPADIRVQDGDTITVGKVTLKVIHTPGHSPGGMALYMPGYVFTGDTLFVEGVGRTDLPGASWELMASSIREKLLSLPDDTVVLPGHNYGRTPTSSIENEKKNNPFLR